MVSEKIELRTGICHINIEKVSAVQNFIQIHKQIIKKLPNAIIKFNKHFINIRSKTTPPDS